MSIENQSLANIKNSTNTEVIKQEEEEAIRAHEEETSILGDKGFWRANLLCGLEECASVEEAHQIIMEEVKEIEENLGEKAKGFAQSLCDMDISNVSSIEDYVDKVSSLLESEIYKRFTLEELEEIQRNEILNCEAHIGVNDIVYYRFSPDQSEITINLHNSKSIHPKEMIRGFLNGLKEIARQMKNDSHMASVKKVNGKSWIIEKHPKIIKRYGFEVTGTDSASISREDFIRMFSNG